MGDNIKTIIDEYKLSITELQKKIKDIQSKISSLILELPDNQDIERVSKSIYIISSRCLINSSWDVRFYDFKLQYREIIISMKHSTDFIKKLSKILEEGKIIKSPRDIIKLHPTVIENIKAMI